MSASQEKCLATTVEGKELERCAEYPRCICGGPEGWPDDGQAVVLESEGERG